MASVKSRRTAIVCILTFEVILVILYAIFVKYHYNADALTPIGQVDENDLEHRYSMFQDVHVMMFVGFGFLMTFLKKYGFSAVGFNFLIASIVIQWAILCQGFFRLEDDGKIHISISSLLNADIASAAILISFGAVLGKVSPLQLVLMGIIETVIFAANEYLGNEVLEATDAGGSMYVHVFGAYFGLAVSFVLSHGVGTKTEGNNLEGSSYQSDISAMIGTIFLWLFWPSFNAGLLHGDDKHRAVINTYLSLAACCVTAFAISSLGNKKNNKFEMVHIQNATLAGGVAIGTAANMMVQPYGALIIGTGAGILSTVGYQFVQACMLKRLRIHDTCGVHNLHGMPGVVAGLIGALMAGLADHSTYGQSLTEVFKARGYKHERTAGEQAGYQLLALTITFAIAIAGGLFTGLSIRNFGKTQDHYDDETFWVFPESEADSNANDEVPIPTITLDNANSTSHAPA